MNVRLHRFFEKRFRKLPKAVQRKTLDSLQCFLNNPHDERLKDHPLQGRLRDKRAFSVTGDVRVIYEQEDGGIVLLDIGTHAQVYRE